MSEYDYDELESAEDDKGETESGDNISEEISSETIEEKTGEKEWDEDPAVEESLKEGEEEGEEKGEEVPKTPLAVDWEELEGALENNSPELHSFVNRITGGVTRLFRGNEDSDKRLREVESDPDYVYIDPISSREQYRWMEEFIEDTEESNLKDKLNIAIDGKGAFRRFKDVLVGYPGERERWFVKRSARLHIHMVNWLATKGMEPTNIPPWEAEDFEGEVPGAEQADDNGQVVDNIAALRQAAHDLVDLIPTRELNTAVAFLEFLRSRRGYRRPHSS